MSPSGSSRQQAHEAFVSSPFEIDHQHRAVMDEVTVGGSQGRSRVDPMYAFLNPPKPPVG